MPYKLMQKYDGANGDELSVLVDNDTQRYILLIDKGGTATEIALEYGTVFLLGGFLRSLCESTARVWAAGNSVKTPLEYLLEMVNGQTEPAGNPAQASPLA